MSEQLPTQGKWSVRPWSMDKDTQESSGSIFAEPHKGHAYAIAMCPRYQSEAQWNADAAFIVKAVNSHEALVKALDDAVNTLEAMDLHTDNPLYDRLRITLEGVSVPSQDRLTPEGK